MKNILIKFDEKVPADLKEPVLKILSKHYNVVFSDTPDFLFYTCFGKNHQGYKDCVKIFITEENTLPNFNDCDYGQAFDYIDFGTRYFRKINLIPPRDIMNRDGVTQDMANRKFCNFIYSNTKMGEGALLRQEFCKALMKYRHVDCPGRVLNNMTAEELAPRDGDWATSKAQFLKQYKFTIAFENSLASGYTTEKLTQPLAAFSVPIYWGNPQVVRDFNPRAFINCSDYNNDFDAIIKRVQELDRDPDKYLAMLRENPMQPDFDFDSNDKFEKWIIDIIERGNRPFNKDPLHFQTMFFRETGNFWYKKIQRNKSEKTYVCGIRIRSRKH